MAFNFFQVLKGLLITQENTLTPTEIQITPGGTAGTRTTIQSSQTTNKTITIPDATDTLVVKDTHQVLTNKDLNADNNLIQVNLASGGVTELTSALDTIKSNIATGSSALTTHINNPTGAHAASAVAVTPSGNLASTDAQSALVELQLDIDTRAPSATAVTLTGTQTLTNKTLTSPAITTPTGIVKGDVGLGNVDNVSDLNKPISTATQTALNLKQDAATAATLTGTQTLTNKTLTAPVIDAVSFTDQGSTPATPAAGTHKAYVKTSTGKLTILDSTGTEVTVGAGSGSTNYIANGDAEAGTTGWATYADAAGSRPVDGTGGTATNVTFTRSTTAPLNGVASFLFTKAAANAQGQGASYDFTINAEDKAKVLTITMSDMVSSGTFTAGTSTTDSDVIVYFYDITNGTLIEPSSFKFLSNSTTIADKFQASFQTASNSTSYRLILHCATTSTSAFVLKLDSISVSPSVYVYGTPVTDWQTYTPTGAWTTNTTYKGAWRRVGDTMEVMAEAALSGAPNATNFTLTLPPGYSIDATKINYGNLTSYSWIGGASVLSSGSSYGAVFVGYTNATTVDLWCMNYNSTSLHNYNAVNNIQPASFQAADKVWLQFKVPILGWSSSVQTSDQTDTRVVAMQAGLTTAQAVSANSPIKFDTVLSDTHTSYSTSTGLYTVIVPGYYHISVNTLTNTSTTVYLNVNGSAKGSFYVSTGGATNSGSKTYLMKAGDTFGIYSEVAGTYNATGTLGFFNSVSVERLSGPSAIAASESINARYTTTATTAISNTPVILPFNTKDYDSHNAYSTSTGLYTVPISGKFRVSAKITTATVTLSTSNNLSVSLYKNGSAYSELNLVIGSGTGANYRVAGSDTINCTAGDTLAIWAAISVSTTLLGAACQISFERIGN